MKVIGSWGICYDLSLNVYQMEYDINDNLIVGWSNEDQLHNLPIYYDNDGNSYVTLHDVNYYLKDCLRV